MSQGSSFLAPVRQFSRFPLGPSGLPLVECPSCGNAVPNSCTFFKWLDSYRRMVKGMELDVNEEVVLPVARSIDGEGVLIEGKMDKLTKRMKLLVLINIDQVVLVVIGVFFMLMK
uniref:Uncharacterized protein n=1 Tax=Oryza punctata TaxID=4537 RepID=A0A0E0MMJ6_ORYPU